MMDFTIPRKTLQQELSFLAGVLDRKNSIPVLGHILLETLPGKLARFTATDLDVTVRATVAAPVSMATGALLVPGHKLLELVRLLPDAPARFVLGENQRLTITCARAKFTLTGLEASHFPEIPPVPAVSLPLPAFIGHAFIARTVFALTEQSSQYALSGAKLTINPQGATMVGTDGHRLALAAWRSNTLPEAAELDVLLPRKALARLGQMAAAHEGDLLLGADENHLYCQAGTRLLIARPLTGDFPRYEPLLPQPAPYTVTCDGPALQQALKRADLMTEGHNHALHFALDAGRLSLRAVSASQGEAHEQLPVTYTGPALEMGFNARYLQDFLNVAGQAQVTFSFHDAHSVAEFRPAALDGFQYRYIVMPMRA